MTTDAALSQAMNAHQRGDIAAAEILYRAFLDQTPDHADACALLGVVVGTRGDFAQAVEWVNKAITIDPLSGLLRFHQGTVLMAASRLPEAIDAFTRAAALEPTIPQIHYNFANALRAADDWKDAIAHYREALRLDPLFLDAYNNLALALVHEKEYGEAMQLAQKAVTLKPAYGDGWLTLCNVAEKLKDYDTALEAAKKAIALIPDNHYAWFGYGVALNRLNRDEEAIPAYQRALALKPSRADLWDNLAQTYQSLNRLDEAEATYRKTIEVAGQIIADEDTREVDENEYGGRHWHLGLIELLRGRYKQGFARYRTRVHAFALLKRPNFPFPLWKGEDLTGKTLLVCDEQSFGDTLMLARFLPPMRAKGVQIIFCIHKALLPLFQGWDGADNVIAHGTTIPACDYYCSSFDLPHRCGTTLETIPNIVPYIPALPPDEATLLPPGKPKIGVVWGGSALHLNDSKRSIPLPLFADLFSLPHLQFYSFNRDLKPGDAELLPHYPIDNLAARLTDFAVAARLIGQMDMVISCDTATAHLAGALGKKTWVLLPFAPDWRWLTERADNPWYPTIRLFRQPSPGDWRSVIAAVKAKIKTDYPA